MNQSHLLHHLDEPRSSRPRAAARTNAAAVKVWRPGEKIFFDVKHRATSEQSGIIDIEVADTMPDGWQRWLDWHRAIAPNNREEIQALETDRGRYLSYVRLVNSPVRQFRVIRRVLR